MCLCGVHLRGSYALCTVNTTDRKGWASRVELLEEEEGARSGAAVDVLISHTKKKKKRPDVFVFV